MKLELVKDAQGEPIGWDLIAETPDEKIQLHNIRVLSFYQKIEYTGTKDGGTTLRWRTPQYCPHCGTKDPNHSLNCPAHVRNKMASDQKLSRGNHS